ncbi:hypothetical protein BT96DRAFT_926343 [Gymnopus androsaceus JB14]|uniref:F-box domain-containing protein n=1 Tax=Gymnopus androsaceus JB14 TaxID=1447944 RepID=A0A6A4GWS1_9AGAR|nr:hypothetical protein BT96DRAFT_926343 [Gymnopus androsaceus JB14]
MVLTVEGIAERMASSRGFFSVVKLYIERSGTLSLRLKIDTMGQFSSSGTTHPVLSLLGQQSNRWQHLTFVGDNCLTREIFAIPDDVYDFPMLEEMKFETVYAGSSMQVLGIAPKLWSVEIDEVKYGMRMIPSWHQLSCVYQVASPPKSLRSLKSLDAIVHGRSDAGLLDNFLASFVCSSLTSLCLERDMDDLPNPPKATWSLRILDSFLTNSSCILTTFSIRAISLQSCRRMPSLTSLTVEDLPHRSHDHPYADQCSSQTITPAFIRSLHSFTSSALRPTFTTLLPRLRYLTLRCAGRVFDDSGFVDMIRSRCLPAYVARRMGIDPLQSLVLTFWDRTPGLFEGISEIYKPFSLLRGGWAGNMLVV